MKYAKSSHSKYLKKLKTLYPDNSSNRGTYGVINNRLTHREFRMVLPMFPKENVALRGSDLKPSYNCVESMNVMINCLKRTDYNEKACAPEVTAFNECYKNYTKEVNEAAERNRMGNFKIAENQTQFPVKFMRQMLAQFKTPLKIDDGPNIPFGKKIPGV